MSLKLLENYDSDENESSEEALSASLTTEDHMKGVGLRKRGSGGLNCNGGDDGYRETKQMKKDKLPLPQALQSMFNSQKADNPKNVIIQKDGTIMDLESLRSFPHVRGNWASFIHISMNNSESIEKLKGLIAHVFEDMVESDMQVCEDFHVSLSKTIVFRHHWIDAFVAGFKQKLSNFESFSLVFEDLKLYKNDEKTKVFLAINVHASKELLDLIGICDNSLSEYDLDLYYEDPAFHASICWALCGKSAARALNSRLSTLNNHWRSITEEEPDLLYHQVDSISFKTGNKIFNFPLKS